MIRPSTVALTQCSSSRFHPGDLVVAQRLRLPAKFIVFNAKLFVFDTQPFVINAKFIIFDSHGDDVWETVLPRGDFSVTAPQHLSERRVVIGMALRWSMKPQAHRRHDRFHPACGGHLGVILPAVDHQRHV